MNELDALIPIEQDDISIGKTTSRDIYDSWGNLLLTAGSIIENELQLKDLIENGHYTDPEWENVAAKPIPASPVQALKSQAPTPSKEQNKETVMLDLDSVRWYVGETFYLQVHDNALIRYTVKLIGFVKNKYCRKQIGNNTKRIRKFKVC